MKTKVLLLSATLFGEMLVASASAGDWTITDIGTLGGSGATGWAISDYGQVIGSSRLPGDANSHPFFYANGVMQDMAMINNGLTLSLNYAMSDQGLALFDPIGRYSPLIYNPYTYQITELESPGYGWGGSGINNFGVVAGYSTLGTSIYHAVYYKNGYVYILRSLDGFVSQSEATAINNAGTIVGDSSYSIGGGSRAVMWIRGSIVDISQGTESYARDINDSGDVVGTANNHAFLWHNGTMQILGALPGGNFSDAFGINNHGDIVGDSYINTTNRVSSHAFLYRDGSMIDLNDLIPTNSGYVISEAMGINNSDQILCWGTADDGISYHTFIVQAPEPGVYSLVAAFGSALFVYRRKRRALRC